MSAELNEVCCHLVGEFFGDFHRHIFQQLVHQGRLSAPQVGQRCHLPLRQIKCGLAVLVQARLVYHHTATDGLVSYQANIDTTYELLRLGRFVELVRIHFGDVGAIVAGNLISLGFATIADLNAKASESLLKHRQNFMAESNQTNIQTNGIHDEVQTAIDGLLTSGFFRNARSAHLQPVSDVRTDVEKIVFHKSSLPIQRTKKMMNELQAKADSEVASRVTTTTREYAFTGTYRDSLKRSMDGDEDAYGRKRQRLHNGVQSYLNGHGHDRLMDCNVSKAEATILFVDLSIVIMETRNRSLATRAKCSVGVKYSKVMDAALHQIPSTSKWESSSTHQEISIQLIRQQLNQGRQNGASHLYAGNGHATTNGHHMTVNSTNKDASSFSYNQIDRGLALLAENDFDFFEGTYGREWTIVKNRLDESLRSHETSKLIRDHLRGPSLRIVRMLMDKGKLDEKALQEIGLLGAKDLRQALAQLKQMGYIDLQEVPRESQRQPNRTIFLWFYNSHRVRRMLLENLYNGMTHLLQRLLLEQRKISTTLDKVERSDVRGNENLYLSNPEKQVLNRWKRIEQWIWGELIRLDESVILLRDL